MARPKVGSPWQSRTISSCRSATSAWERESTIWFRSRRTSTSTRYLKRNGEFIRVGQGLKTLPLRLISVLTDTEYMARALAIAERGRGRTSPNPMVGAVVVDREGVVVGRGTHEFAGGPHAEVHALRDAGERARGGTLYCTLEPCSHIGRTGACAPVVADAGLTRVVVATADPNPLVNGSGLEILRRRGISVTAGILDREARTLNAPFFTVMTRHRPFITMKVALSADHRIAMRPGVRTSLTGPAAARLIHRDR